MKQHYSYTANEMGEKPIEIKISLENRIKAIFYKEKIKEVDVIVGNKLIKEWKKITGYKSIDNP
jgi:hypothetical protein